MQIWAEMQKFYVAAIGVINYWTYSLLYVGNISRDKFDKHVWFLLPY